MRTATRQTRTTVMITLTSPTTKCWSRWCTQRNNTLLRLIYCRMAPIVDCKVKSNWIWQVRSLAARCCWTVTTSTRYTLTSRHHLLVLNTAALTSKNNFTSLLLITKNLLTRTDISSNIKSMPLLATGNRTWIFRPTIGRTAWEIFGPFSIWARLSKYWRKPVPSLRSMQPIW